MTFKEDILHEAGDEAIEAIVVGNFGWTSDFKEPSNDTKDFGFEDNKSRKPIPVELKGKPVPFEAVADYLHYNYRTGYGAPDCHAIAAYTPTRVILVGQYDGTTWLYSVPRNPSEFLPIMEGG